MSATCPREGCGNTLSAGQIVCSGDFTALAGMCRGKNRLGQPVADMIESNGGGIAYRCPLCLQYHNGSKVRLRMEMIAAARATVRAFRADPRVGARGVLRLADAWESRRVNRSRWAEGLDQREALAASWHQ